MNPKQLWSDMIDTERVLRVSNVCLSVYEGLRSKGSPGLAGLKGFWFGLPGFNSTHDHFENEKWKENYKVTEGLNTCTVRNMPMKKTTQGS